MPTLKVNEIISYSGNTLSLGTSGNTVTLPANVTFNALSGNVYIPNGIIKLDAITVSATTTFNLTYGGSAYSPASANACLVSVNGVIQTPGTAFTISGSQIIFTSALSATDTINFIIVLAAPYTLNVPGGGTVGFNEITSNLITGATAVTVPATDDVLLCYDTSATALRKITFANFGNAPAFSAVASTSQTISSVTTTILDFQTENFDTDNAYDGTNKFTAPITGKYFFRANIRLNSMADGDEIQLNFLKNGSQESSATNFTRAAAAASYAFGITGLFNLTANDYIQVATYQTNASSKSTTAASTAFSGFRLIGV